MNTKNNKRRRESVEKIERAFVQLIQENELKDITVSEICNMTGLNRSTFYANFIDIYDLADKVRDELKHQFDEEFADRAVAGDGAVRMFRHIKENQLFYKTYFKLEQEKNVDSYVYDLERADKDFGNRNIGYHIEFFRCGLNALIKMWLGGGCVESPEEMAEILKQEYGGRK